MHPALKLLRKIPKGKVTTYGALAKAFNNTAEARSASLRLSPRAVGQIMRNNKEPGKYPCYKVIKSDGSVGGYCGKTSGKEVNEKIRKLEKDGILVKNGKIDEKYFYFF